MWLAMNWRNQDLEEGGVRTECTASFWSEVAQCYRTHYPWPRHRASPRGQQGRLLPCFEPGLCLDRVGVQEKGRGGLHQWEEAETELQLQAHDSK